ncbi:hypothetical protein ACR6C2_04390 [Streptomyces sp. INA 01156]
MAGTLMMSAGMACGALSYRSLRTWKAELGWLATLVELALMIVLLPGGRWAIRQGSRHRAQVLQHFAGLPQDKPVVLLLRSFADDAGLARVQQGSMRDGPWAASTETEEDQLAKAVLPFGTMVALGQPNDRLPQVGAARHYPSDLQWQEEVLTVLDRATLVLLVCGPGRNLRWEVEQVVARDRPERLVLIGVRDTAQYESFRQAMHDLFPKGLPPSSQVTEGPADPPQGPETYVREAVWFDADWTPHLSPLGGDDPEVEVLWLLDHHAWVRTAFPLAVRLVYRRGPDPPGLPSTRVSRPWAVKAAVPLLTLAWGTLLTAMYRPGTDILPVLIFVALPWAALLYGTWRGAMLAISILMLLTGLFALMFCIAVFFPSEFATGRLSLPFAVSLVTGLLLLNRQDVRRWSASLAYKTVPTSPRR